ncbi:hypothetical protein C2G38_2216835 [Gigaspora rosea]|uniref:Uncharacterized protein n=1 Tax=Gigaspora rosea TaxID=44941 RepID=A0A397UBU4_9GLOM|nr:hypothetical protein C2G38_2216835 [Gigaspora rosea]
MLRACGCHNVIPWTPEESQTRIKILQYQLWTKNAQLENDHAMLHQLYLGFLNSSPSYVPNKTHIFWQSFTQALMDNKRTRESKRQVLLIIANDFSYSDLKTNLGVKTLWNKFHEKYPNSMQRTTFITRLKGSRFVYKENLGGLCIICNEIGYEVFENIESLINTQIKNNKLKENVDSKFHESLIEYQNQLIYFMAHHAQMKSEFFGKRRWTLHSVFIYTQNAKTSNLDVQAYNHWSNDTKQDIWFTTSSLNAVIESLNPIPKWITIISDNGPHYHNTDEAKTSIDSHHAQITYAIKRYVKFDHDIDSGEDIERAIKDIARTHVAHLEPNRN